jgi:hypothetical protein
MKRKLGQNRIEKIRKTTQTAKHSLHYMKKMRGVYMLYMTAYSMKLVPKMSYIHRLYTMVTMGGDLSQVGC